MESEKQNKRNRLIETDNKPVVVIGDEVGDMSGKGEVGYTQ